MITDNSPENNIPVLTDIITLNNEWSVPEAAEMTGPEPKPEPAPQVQPFAGLEELEKAVHDHVLNQLLSRIDFVLEYRVRDSLAEVLHTASDELVKEIRRGLENSLKEVIQRAITQELSKIQTTTNN